MRNRPTRVRMLIGAERGSDYPYVIGCVDETTWEIEGQDDTDHRWRAYKTEMLGGGEADYDFREIVVELDTAELRALMGSPVVKGKASADPGEVASLPPAPPSGGES